MNGLMYVIDKLGQALAQAEQDVAERDQRIAELEAKAGE